LAAFLSWHFASPAQAARRCSSSFRLTRSGGSKAKNKAKSYAQRKLWRAARKRCGIARITLRVSKRWASQCRRKRGLHKCRVSARFRCCKGTLRRSTLTTKQSLSKQPRRSRISKRRRLTRKKRRKWKKSRRLCLRKVRVTRSALSRRKPTARRVARKKVYRSAKKRCGARKIKYMAAWRYRCKRKGKYFRCSASNTVRCCRRYRKRRITRRSRRKGRRPRRKSSN
jgi:hypothetical protein